MIVMAALLLDLAIVSAVAHFGSVEQATIAAVVLVRWELGRLRGTDGDR